MVFSLNFVPLSYVLTTMSADKFNMYLDILVKATQAGMRCLLWYGFMTGDEVMMEVYIEKYCGKSKHNSKKKGHLSQTANLC